MKKTVLLLAVAVLMLPVVASAGPMKAGKWQVTVETEMAGVNMKLPPTTVTTCVTKEQAEKPELPQGKDAKDCKISDYKIDGNTVTWKMECPKQNMKGTGSMKFTGDAYEGTNDFTVGEQKIKSKMKGKRVGECEGQ